MALRGRSPMIAWIGMLVLVGCTTGPSQVARLPCVLPAAAPTTSVSDPGLASAVELEPPKRWLVLGMFPNPTLTSPSSSGASRGGVDQDYLVPLGGETAAIITADSKSRFETASEPIEVREAKTEALGLVELDKVFPKSSNRILYAYAELNSDRAQTAFVHFGVDDSAKVWVNGQLVHHRFHPGRPVSRWAEEFPVTLVRGSNRVLIKVDNGWRGAAFMFEPFTAEAHDAQVSSRAEEQVGDEAMSFADGGGFIRSEGALPDVVWKNAAYASWALGSPEIAYSWYGPDGKVVGSADRIGLYTAIATYRTKRGLTVRRALPLLRTPLDFWQRYGWTKTLLAKPDGVSTADWKAFERSTAKWTSELMQSAPIRDRASAIVLSELVVPPLDDVPSSHAAFIRWQQVELDLKRKILGLGEGKRVGPTRRAMAAPVLHQGTAQQAGIKPESVVQLRRLATEWAQSDNQPFVLLLARHGVIFMHEAFGKLDKHPVALDHLFRPASIGKNFAALVFAQFLERNWLRPSELVGEVLSSWPRSGPKAVTFRQLFDHTAGLRGHTTFSGLDNPWLEEAFAAHVLPNVDVGLRYEYEGDGSNIAAKAMELLDGRAFPILQREALFRPLGANSIDQWDGGWAAVASTLDMAKVAQMLLQKGAYGDWQFFGEKTWEALLPRPLAALYPKLTTLDVERGIGLEHCWDPESDTEQHPKSLHTVGHGAASTSIYRIDYRHDAVMVAGRVSAPDGEGYDEHLHDFVRTLESAMVD